MSASMLLAVLLATVRASWKSEKPRCLGLEQQLVGYMGDVVVLLQLVLDPDDVLQLLEEPAVDLRQLVDALDGVPVLQRVRDDEGCACRSDG